MAVQLVVAGTPLQERLMLPEKPSLADALKLYVAVCPALIVWDAAEPKEKSKAFPLSGTEKTAWLGTFVLRFRLPAVAPPAVGVNVTLIWQVPPTAIVVHPFTVEKPTAERTLST